MIARPTRRLRHLALLALLLAVAAAVFPAAAASAQDDPGTTTTTTVTPLKPEDKATRPGRLFVFSVPGVTWADIGRNDLPNLTEYFSGAAMADLAPRGVFVRSGPGDAYLTISGGSRATSERFTDGQVLAVDESSSGSDAGDIFMRRTGEEPDGPFVSLAWPTLVRLNDAEPFDTKLGSLTETLEKGGVSAAAIGNADGTDSIGESYERQAGLAMADPSGVVPAGSLGKDLLMADPAAPFGLRLDPEIVDQRFVHTWSDAKPRNGSGGGVVLVEASDLARTLRYRPIVDIDRYAEMWQESLHHSDELFGRLMKSVDLTKDTVMVVGPYNKRADRDLTVVAMRGPGIEPGFLHSASTQRPGFLTLVDIGPTILDTFGLPRPVDMEGRPALVEPSSDTAAQRVHHLISLNSASRFRELLLTPTTTLIMLGLAALLALTIAAHANRWSTRARSAIALGGLFILTLLPASYLARAFPLEEKGTGFYWTFLLSVSVIVPVVATLIGRWRKAPRAALVTVLALMALVLIIDVVTGSHLSLNAAFGYSPTGNSRLYGISNYSYGQLAAATCLLAAWIAALRPGRVGNALGIGTMLVTLVVLGVPTWGSDVGGVLAFTPAVAAFAVVVTKRRIRFRTVVIGGLSTVVAIGVFGALDLMRPTENRGHLGRLFERVGDEGFSPLISVVQRKLVANLAVSTSSLWVLAIPIGIAFWIFLRKYPTRPYALLVAGFGTLPAGMAAALVAGVLGSALNDSGAIIGGIMAMVVASALAVLLLDVPPPALEGASEPVVEAADEPSSEGVDDPVHEGVREGAGIEG